MVEIRQIYLVGAIFTAVILIILYIILKRYINRNKYEKPELLKYLKSIDGHIVKSKGELIIDNYLYLNGIQHIYEKKLKIKGQKVKTDWYLPEYNAFIEYWGYYGKEYMKRKKEKLKIYRKAKLKLISVENRMFNDIYQNLNKFLQKKNNVKDKKSLDHQNRYCYYCGTYLDERF
ncbi:MAG: hypothetical protein ACFE85_16885 [Candidatus Hodarchaeota archaeon]